MKILSLDYGYKRIGVSVGEIKVGIAFPRDILFNDKRVNEEILKICEHNAIKKIIIGHPLMLDSSPSESSERVLVFKEELEKYFKKKKCDLIVELFDERFSTNIAEYKIKLHPKQKKLKKYVDSFAAQVILEDYFRRNS
jgi:putative transcription antitermination factor YqgF